MWCIDDEDVGEVADAMVGEMGEGGLLGRNCFSSEHVVGEDDRGMAIGISGRVIDWPCRLDATDGTETDENEGVALAGLRSIVPPVPVPDSVSECGLVGDGSVGDTGEMGEIGGTGRLWDNDPFEVGSER